MRDDNSRPKTRAECPPRTEAGRPCPFVGCKHHVYTDLSRKKKAVTDPADIAEPCVLDFAERGGMVLEDVGEVFGVTRERIRQIEDRALAKLRARAFHLGEFIDLYLSRTSAMRRQTFSAFSVEAKAREGRVLPPFDIRNRRVELGLTGPEIAAHMGLKKYDISRLELGQSRVSRRRIADYRAAVEHLGARWANVSRRGGERAQLAGAILGQRMREIKGSVGIHGVSAVQHGITALFYGEARGWVTRPPKTIRPKMLRAIFDFCDFHGEAIDWILPPADAFEVAA